LRWVGPPVGDGVADEKKIDIAGLGDFNETLVPVVIARPWLVGWRSRTPCAASGAAGRATRSAAANTTSAASATGTSAGSAGRLAPRRLGRLGRLGRLRASGGRGE
jgi:hypothetical protein